MVHATLVGSTLVGVMPAGVTLGVLSAVDITVEVIEGMGIGS